MKKMILALVAMMAIATSGKAMSYEQARNEALFLTDKMAYELNLTDEQYEAAYEINLDYLMGVTNYDDVYGDYWERRNRDLSYVLLDAQWTAFIAANYFYRPLYWHNGYWHFGIYARYPRRDYFYFGRPTFYATYRGAHAWHLHGHHGYYYSRRDHFRPSGHTHFGMLDRWNRGDFRHHHGNAGHHRPNTGNHRHDNFGGPRTSSTRTTVNHNSNGAFSGNRGNRGNHGSHGDNRPSGVNSSNGNHHSSGSFGGNRGGSSSSHHSSGSFSGNRGGSGSRAGGSFSGSRGNSGSRASGGFSGNRGGGRR